MYRIATLIALGMAALPAIAATDAVDATKTVPTPGQWSTVVAILDSSDNHYLLKTNVANDPASCMDALKKIADKVQETGGSVWTTPDKKNLSYDKEPSPPNYAYTRAKVLELRCVREPFEGELISK